MFCTHVPASVPKFRSQPGLGPDCLAATDLERQNSDVFPAEEAGLFHEHGVASGPRHFSRRYLKANKVSKSEGTRKLSLSQLQLFKIDTFLRHNIASSHVVNVALVRCCKQRCCKQNPPDRGKFMTLIAFSSRRLLIAGD